MAVEGRTAIDTLITKDGEVADLADLEGTTIGVKGKLPASIAVMLLEAGLAEGENFDTVLLDGFDPTAHIAIEPIVGFPGWKSNEPGALTRAGIDYQLFDPLDSGCPGSFGVDLHQPELRQRPPDRRRGLHAGDDARPRRRDRRPRGGGEHRRRADQRRTATRTSCRRRARSSAGDRRRS